MEDVVARARRIDVLAAPQTQRRTPAQTQAQNTDTDTDTDTDASCPLASISVGIWMAAPRNQQQLAHFLNPKP